MKQVKQIIFNSFAAISAIACVAVIWSWCAESYSSHYEWRFAGHVTYGLKWSNGGVELWRVHLLNRPWTTAPNANGYLVLNVVREWDICGVYYRVQANPWLASEANPALSEGWKQQVAISFWCFIAVTAPLPFFWIIRRWRRKPIVDGKCPVCGYDLRATPTRCPECGKEIQSQLD